MYSVPNLYVLDDDEQYAKLLCKAAEKYSGQVRLETNAINFLHSSLPERFILVLDLVMPEVDGIEVIRTLSRKKYDVSLILVSGFDERVLHSAQQLAEAHGMPVHGCFTKPIKIPDLSNLFLILLRNRNVTIEDI